MSATARDRFADAINNARRANNVNALVFEDWVSEAEPGMLECTLLGVRYRVSCRRGCAPVVSCFLVGTAWPEQLLTGDPGPTKG